MKSLLSMLMKFALQSKISLMTPAQSVSLQVLWALPD